jgi:uncharacterized FAD-dependent dehydrogenase
MLFCLVQLPKGIFEAAVSGGNVQILKIVQRHLGGDKLREVRVQ